MCSKKVNGFSGVTKLATVSTCLQCQCTSPSARSLQSVPLVGSKPVWSRSNWRSVVTSMY